jgi:hypothetical protein
MRIFYILKNVVGGGGGFCLFICSVVFCFKIQRACIDNHSRGPAKSSKQHLQLLLILQISIELWIFNVQVAGKLE